MIISNHKVLKEEIDMKAGKLALKNASLIKCNGEDVIENSLVLVDEDKIVYAGEFKADMDLDGYKEVDLAGKTVMPGMTEAHIHFSGVKTPYPKDWLCQENTYSAMVAASQAQTVLEYGFTSARDITRFSVDLRKAVNEKVIKGPRIFAAGRGLCRTGGHGDWPELPIDLVDSRHPWATIADTEDGCRKRVREILRTGVDMIKVYPTGGGIHDLDREKDIHYTQAEMNAIVEEAANYGVSVMSHAEGVRGAKISLRAGCKSIEHGEELDDECIDLMIKNDVYLIPTLSVLERCFMCYGAPYRGKIVESFPGDTLAEKELNRVFSNFKKCLDAGVKIALGSDSFASDLTPYGEDSLREIRMFVRAGGSAEQALTAAAKNGAELLGFGGITGSVEEGKMADLVILDADPLEDINNLCKENIKAVMKEGEIVAGEL